MIAVKITKTCVVVACKYDLSSPLALDVGASRDGYNLVRVNNL